MGIGILGLSTGLFSVDAVLTFPHSQPLVSRPADPYPMDMSIVTGETVARAARRLIHKRPKRKGRQHKTIKLYGTPAEESLADLRERI